MGSPQLGLPRLRVLVTGIAIGPMIRRGGRRVCANREEFLLNNFVRLAPKKKIRNGQTTHSQ